MTVKDVIDHLRILKSYLITLGRLNFAELLLHNSIDSKLICAEKGFSFINHANNIETFLVKFLNQKKGTIRWDNVTHKSVIESFEQNKFFVLKKLKVEYEKKSFTAIALLKRQTDDDLLIYQLSDALKSLTDFLNQNKQLEKTEIKKLNTEGDKNFQRVIYGPRNINIDKVFAPSYEILNNPIPEFGETLEDIVPYFWSLSLREILAAELCALSMVEYDNLPIQFYWDFAKQSWDEARHSKIYLNLSLSLFDDAITMLDKSNPLSLTITAFKNKKAGLPVPREKNMYEAILNAELEERLILMNILTEAPAIARLTRKMKKEICSQYPEIKRTFEFDKIDESFHARIGNYWLKYLIQDPKVRRQKIENTKLLRGFLLLTSLSEYSNSDLTEIAIELTKK